MAARRDDEFLKISAVRILVYEKTGTNQIKRILGVGMDYKVIVYPTIRYREQIFRQRITAVREIVQNK